MRIKMALLAFVGFFAGGIVGGVCVPRASAQAPVPRPRFEYFCQSDIQKPWKGDVQKLNALGAQGWELVQQLVGLQGTNGDVYCFKRTLP